MTAIDGDAGFLDAPTPTADARRLLDGDVEQHGYVMNLSQLWAHQPAVYAGLLDLLGATAQAGALTVRQRGVLVSAMASTLGDAYCSLAWGQRLAGEAGAEVAGAVLRGDDAGLDAQDRALAHWARRITRDPNGTGPNDVELLRDAGFDDDQIFAITAFVALRIAFSTVNDALGARPDRVLGDTAPPAVRDAVTYGRPIGDT